MLVYFFLAGHVQYARYLTQYVKVEMPSLPDDAKVDTVCRHTPGFWNGVSSDQFGEQTSIRLGKGGLKGITLSPDLVKEWIDAFPISVYISGIMETIYEVSNGSTLNSDLQTKHKEELWKRRALDAADRDLVADSIAKYPHPLEDSRPYLFNPVSGQIASDEVNVVESLVIGEQLKAQFVSKLPIGFHDKISSPIKTMASEKRKQSQKASKTMDLETLFFRLLILGQQRQLELGPLFAYELCNVPPSLIDEYGCLRKGNKSGLVKRLRVLKVSSVEPDALIVDASQLLYHIAWPNEGKPDDIIVSFKRKLQKFSTDVKKVLVYDKYKPMSAKDHERLRRYGETNIDYDITAISTLPKRNILLKNKENKRRLSKVLGLFSIAENVIQDNVDDGDFGHDEADVTMVSYAIQFAKDGLTVRLLSDDTDVFILLVFWVYKNKIGTKVEMERWDGHVIDINATCHNLGAKCLQLLAMHALSGCDTTSYLYGKGKINALNAILKGDCPGLLMLGEENADVNSMIEDIIPFFKELYGQKNVDSIETARFNLFKKKKKPTVMSLPPTEPNLKLHILRAHLQVMLWKAADQSSPPVQTDDITKFGWIFKGNIPVPQIAQNDPAPREIIDVIKCQCKSDNNACGTRGCRCHRENNSCNAFCNCSSSQCCNPYTKKMCTQLHTSEDNVNSDDEDGVDEMASDDEIVYGISDESSCETNDRGFDDEESNEWE